MSPRTTRRNLTVALTTAAGVGLLMLYPTSTHSRTNHRKPGVPLAAAGIVRPKLPTSTTVVNGRSVDTAYGPVQVQLAIKDHRIVKATAIDFPQGSGTDRRINHVAIPILQQETLTAQSAQIDTVSGATFTSEGYLTSLQSALDLAHVR